MVLQFRVDPLKGSIVVVANERSLRPMSPKISCPFCPGAESVTPPTKLALPDKKEWKVRCFDNAFAIVKPKGKYQPKKQDDFFYSAAAYGEHEVIVETPDHHQLFQDIDNPAHLQFIFKAYKARVASLLKRKGTKYVHLYKNHGRLAGASIDHEHSQALSLPFVPPMINEEFERAKAYRKKTGKCLTCAIMEREKANIIFQNEHFTAFCPSFARFPFEVWIVSKDHRESLLQFDDVEGGDFIRLLQSCIRAIYKVSKDYNVVYHNNFFGENDAHFHAEIYPRPNIWAGLELGTGVIVNTKTEQESLAALKAPDYSDGHEKPQDAATAQKPEVRWKRDAKPE